MVFLLRCGVLFGRTKRGLQVATDTLEVKLLLLCNATVAKADQELTARAAYALYGEDQKFDCHLQ